MEVRKGHSAEVVSKFVSSGVAGTCILGSTTCVGPSAQVT